MPSKPVAGIVVLNDLDPHGIYVFMTEALPVNQEVEVQIAYPRTLNVYGKVSGYRAVEVNQRIHSKHVYPFRVRIEFTFLNDGDASAVREYCNELSGTPRKKAA